MFYFATSDWRGDRHRMPVRQGRGIDAICPGRSVRV